MDALFDVSFQVQHLRRTSARRMAGSVQERQQVVGVALTSYRTNEDPWSDRDYGRTVYEYYGARYPYF
jgi:hypothetical protein